VTREAWHVLAGEWAAILGITERPRLLVVPASEIPGDDARADFDDCRATQWTIRIRRGHHKDPDLIICHELLHVRTRLTDATHESWICDVAAALVALKRRGHFVPQSSDKSLKT
jgi:hypothetical protein